VLVSTVRRPPPLALFPYAALFRPRGSPRRVPSWSARSVTSSWFRLLGQAEDVVGENGALHLGGAAEDRGRPAVPPAGPPFRRLRLRPEDEGGAQQIAGQVVQSGLDRRQQDLVHAGLRTDGLPCREPAYRLGAARTQRHQIGVAVAETAPCPIGKRASIQQAEQLPQPA